MATHWHQDVDKRYRYWPMLASNFDRAVVAGLQIGANRRKIPTVTAAESNFGRTNTTFVGRFRKRQPSVSESSWPNICKRKACLLMRRRMKCVLIDDYDHDVAAYASRLDRTRMNRPITKLYFTLPKLLIPNRRFTNRNRLPECSSFPEFVVRAPGAGAPPPPPPPPVNSRKCKLCKDCMAWIICAWTTSSQNTKAQPSDRVPSARIQANVWNDGSTGTSFWVQNRRPFGRHSWNRDFAKISIRNHFKRTYRKNFVSKR